jgi:hypothetical protein
VIGSADLGTSYFSGLESKKNITTRKRKTIESAKKTMAFNFRKSAATEAAATE